MRDRFRKVNLDRVLACAALPLQDGLENSVAADPLNRPISGLTPQRPATSEPAPAAANSIRAAAPERGAQLGMAGLEGLEPPTYWFEARRSIQLSYRPAASL